MGKTEELTPEEVDRNIEMWKIKRVPPDLLACNLV
jgi:hypothetical protein